MQFELTPLALPDDYTETILPLAECKAHLAVLEDDHDDLIRAYRDAAIDMVERYCGVRLGPVEDVTVRIECLPSPLDLGVWPVTAITAITWLDQQGNAVEGTHDDWRVIRRGTIGLKPGRALPSGVGGGVEIMVNAGFPTPPPALVQAARMFMAHLFLHRETVITGTISGEIPLGFRQLCAQYRIPVI
ncbi:MAG: head-tail connector protein [Rhabdaerophilum sp.]